MENKDKLKTKINEFIDIVVDRAEQEGKIDYFNIEISNHQGNLQMQYSLKDREKVY